MDPIHMQVNYDLTGNTYITGGVLGSKKVNFNDLVIKVKNTGCCYAELKDGSAVDIGMINEVFKLLGIALNDKFIPEKYSKLKGVYHRIQIISGQKKVMKWQHKDTATLILNNITNHLNTFREIRSLACVSKEWKFYCDGYRNEWLENYIVLEKQSRFPLLEGFKTAEEVINSLTSNENKNSVIVANLEDLPDLTEEHLKRLFENCPRIKHLMIGNSGGGKIKALPPECSRLLTLDCSNLSLEELPNFPYLTTLICEYCTFKELPKLPFLKKLNCNYCELLEKFPEMPLLQELQCARSKLPELPFFPLLQELNCNDCQFPELPEMPLLQVMSCNRTKFDKLPNFPLLTTLNCIGCQFQELKEYPLLAKLVCSESAMLKKISNYPLLKELDCSKCPNLTQLTTFPLLLSLNCSNCPIAFLPSQPMLQILTSYEISDFTLGSLPNLKLFLNHGCSGLQGQENIPKSCKIIS